MASLISIVWIILAGFWAGQGVRRLGLPPLLGMVGAGILLGPEVSGLLDTELLGAAAAFRTIAVMIILMKAGLGLDRQKLRQQGSVALRLGFLPALSEALLIAVASVGLLGLDWRTGLILGCVIGAESPAVIVPGMLRLKSLGWGVSKGIPDAILTGSALSDVLLLLLFSLLMAGLSPERGGEGLELPIWLGFSLQVVCQIGLGIVAGWWMARLERWLFTQHHWAQNVGQEVLITAAFALGMVVAAERLPIFSGYLAVMAAGFFLIEMDPPLADRLRRGFDHLWVGAEIFLFVLLGSQLPLSVLTERLGVGILILGIGTLLGRSLGWYLSTVGSNWTLKERLFLLPANSAKATVQAAIGAIPLSQGLSGGEDILALSALSILLTAPLGAWAIPTFAPRLLERGEVDPSKSPVDGDPGEQARRT